MNTISGKVVVKETALPIPNVLAVLADATAGGKHRHHWDRE